MDALALTVHTGELLAACTPGYRLIARERMVVRVGRHVYGALNGADGRVWFARVPRSERVGSVGVTRDREWSARSEATPVRACRHKRGHTPTHTHGAPPVPRWMRRTIDALACTVFGHDPRAVADVSRIAECAAALTPGYALREAREASALAWLEAREAHIYGERIMVADEHGVLRVSKRDASTACADCKRGERNTSWTRTVRDQRTSTMPVTRATRDANARLARTRVSTYAERVAADWARVCALALADERMRGYERRARV
jgi:hypothetical protein